LAGTPVVIIAHYELLRWLMQRVEKYPRGYRFTLGGRIIGLALEVLEHLVEAAYTKNRSECLRGADLSLAKLRYLGRLAKDERCVSLRSTRNPWHQAPKSARDPKRRRMSR